jgi:hypothetical protein
LEFYTSQLIQIYLTKKFLILVLVAYTTTHPYLEAASLAAAVPACIPAPTGESSTVTVAVRITAVVHSGGLHITVTLAITPTIRAAAIYEMAVTVLLWVVAVLATLLITAAA